MDGSTIEHSDSDSGDSWTLLDHNPCSAVGAPDVPESTATEEKSAAENTDKDEDTDGISIISDSEAESSTPCEQLNYEISDYEDRPETEITKCVLSDPQPSNTPMDLQNSIKTEEYFLGDNSKMRTYVHRRNKRLSTVLNIIVLGSIITAAGVAIGHMWGIRDDCTLQSAQSINKILSNLYKLQEENAYLRSKLKEFKMTSNLQNEQQKSEGQKPTPKHQLRCKKVFEESLDKENVKRITKCVDKELDSHLIEPDFEKDFKNDITKLKNVYRQNKSLLDDEVSRRLKYEENSVKRLKNKHRLENNASDNIQFKKIENPLNINFENEKKMIKEKEDSLNVQELEDPSKIISYADSLKSEKGDPGRKRFKRNISQVSDSLAEHSRRKKAKKDDNVSEKSLSENELKKDDRYVRHKFKLERKKNDRQKLLKKQKRKNKYEQWEMKGGYMKDYDDFSVTSSRENSFILKNPDKNHKSREFERTYYINQFSDSDDNIKSSDTDNVPKKKRGKKSIEKLDMEKPNPKSESDKSTQKGNKGKGSLEWFEKRASMRSDARKRLEQELFGDSSPNNAAWYFRRMQKREQCRVRSDNSSHRKIPKRGMNFKTKQ